MTTITLKDSLQLELVEKLLKDAGVDYEVRKPEAFEEFCHEEASYRLEEIKENNGYEIPDYLENIIVTKIANRWDSSPILDYDYMDDIVREEIEEALELTKNLVSTAEYFGLSYEELSEMQVEEGITKESTLLMNEGVIIFCESVKRYLLDMNSLINSQWKYGHEFKKALVTVDNKVAMIFTTNQN